MNKIHLYTYLYVIFQYFKIIIMSHYKMYYKVNKVVIIYNVNMACDLYLVI